MNKTTNILVIGGGFAGATVAQELEKAGTNVTLVDRKNYFEVTIAMLRNVADFNKIKDTPRVKYEDFIKGDFVQASVLELTEKEALLDNGDRIIFEQVIIASGSSYHSFPIAKSTDALTFDARHQEIKEASEALSKAKSVLVIGAGAVGVELAGEIAYRYPHIKVTLAESGDSVLSAFSEKTQRKATEQLKSLGIKIETNRLYQAQGDAYVDSKTGDQLKVDIAYMAVGVKPNSEFMQAHLANSITDRGFIKVDDYYQVTGTQNLYAIGDVATLKDLKLASAAMRQGKKLVANLIAKQRGNKMKAHSAMPAVSIFPIGQEKGIAQMPFGTVTWKILVNIKNKDLLIGSIFKSIGAK